MNKQLPNYVATKMERDGFAMPKEGFQIIYIDALCSIEHCIKRGGLVDSDFPLEKPDKYYSTR
jgi:hypothetical protein